MRLARSCPEGAEGERRILAVAATEETDPGRFVVKLGLVNCGERLDRDYWGFLHFEPEATGENLAVTSALGLYPSGQPTDSAAWREDEVTILTFGPYAIPSDIEQPLYLRAGMYDHDADGGRLRLLGSGERDRVLVGRFVPTEGGIMFERIVPWLKEGPR